MDGDECTHSITDGVCRSCGMCFEGDNLVSVRMHTMGMRSENIQPRYITRQPRRQMSPAARNIISALGLNCYEPQIIALIGTLRFTVRLCHEDKVAVILYNLCKHDGFPLALSDLLHYTKTNKFRFLKAHRDIFGYEEASVGYLKAVFCREVENAASHGIMTDFTVEMFLGFVKKFSASNASDLCIAAILHFCKSKNKLSTMLTSLERNENAGIRRLYKRMSGP